MKREILCILIWLLLLPLGGRIFAITLPGKAKLIEGVTYKETPQGTLKLDIFKPDSTVATKCPVFVFIHGGSWMHLDRTTLRSAFRKQLLDKLLQEGYAVISIDYRLANEKKSVIYPAPLADCKDAVRWIRRESDTYGFDTARIAVGGCSAGGHLSLMTAYSPDALAPGDESLCRYSSHVNCCVDFYGPTHLGKMFLPTLLPPVVALAHLAMPKDLMKTRKTLLWAFTNYSSAHPRKRHRLCKQFSPVTYASHAVPTIIFHGNKDGLVHYVQSQLLQKKMLKQKKAIMLHTLEGEDHGFPTLSQEKGQQIAKDTYNFLVTYNHN